MSLKENDQYQEQLRENIITSNLEKKKKDGGDELGWGYNRCVGYRCIRDGREVSPAIVKFFNYDVTKLLCYKCQEELKSFNK